MLTYPYVYVIIYPSKRVLLFYVLDLNIIHNLYLKMNYQKLFQLHV